MIATVANTNSITAERAQGWLSAGNTAPSVSAIRLAIAASATAPLATHSSVPAMPPTIGSEGHAGVGVQPPGAANPAAALGQRQADQAEQHRADQVRQDRLGSQHPGDDRGQAEYSGGDRQVDDVQAESGRLRPRA